MMQAPTRGLRLRDLLGPEEDWLAVRHRVSETPLAAAHERLLAGARPRVKSAIPWNAFVRSDYPEQALALACDQAHKLAEGEYAAVALFAQITSGLTLTSAPFDIVSAAASIGGDEIRHAEYCLKFAQLCADRELELRVPLHEVRDACSDLHDAEGVDFVLLKYSAIGETLAAALLNECQHGAKDRVARALYRALAGDEVRHARLGWYYLSWRAARWTLPEKQRLADRIAEFVVELESTFWTGRDAPEDCRAASAALGVLDSERQRDVITNLMSEEIVPALDALGLGGSHMWGARTGGEVTPVVQAPGHAATPDEATTIDAAATWLAGAVADDGSLRFALDPRGEPQTHGLMHHGRAALVLAALDAHGGFVGQAARLRGWLQRELAAAERGELVAAWPTDPRHVAGSLALAQLAGLDVRQWLLRAASAVNAEGSDSVWHGAQVITALGAEHGVSGLWPRCVAALAQDAWAPWTARAAHVLDDQATLSRARGALVSALATDALRSGTSPPAIAVVAASLEALAATNARAGASIEQTATAIAEGRDYLLRWQCLEDTSAAARGAFPISPTDSTLRSDVTAHALLALLATRSARQD